MSSVPTCRWGIVATGLISSWFVSDIVIERSDAKARHVIQAIGSSSTQKGKDFAAKYCPNAQPTIYSSYEEVYNDPNVDCVYIGTPHAWHKKNTLAAIDAGKNVLCEKAFTINAKEAKEIYAAAEKKGVYVAEAMWLRHRPLVAKLRELLYEEKVIGDVFRTFSEFSMLVDIAGLPQASRYRDPALGAGALLDIGVYSLTWAFLTLDPNGPNNPETPKVLATQTHLQGIEVTSSILLHYPDSGRQGVIMSSTNASMPNELICRVQGMKGHVEIYGSAPSHPSHFTVFTRTGEEKYDNSFESKKYEFPHPGQGFIFEADDTALDIAAGRKESPVIPWKESIRVMEIMDEIRRQGGTKYPQDED